ncbi:MAG: response regulator [Actinomycetota bacterium]
MSLDPGLVLVADDDNDIVRFVEVNLRLEGFDVSVASDGEQALEQANDLLPDLVLLDVMMPKVDGFEVCRRIRDQGRTKHISVIMLTARALSADKVVGLTKGADDYIIKPFDPVELIARVKSALRRARETRSVSPLTQLPGHVEMQQEVAARVAVGAPFAVMYIDLDSFKAFNDRYGFERGETAIKTLADRVTAAVRLHDRVKGFVAHIGGDDFVAVVEASAAEDIASEIVKGWDRAVPGLYDDEDAERGYIDVTDRRNQVHHFPLITVSVGVATNAHRRLTSHWEATEIATDMRRFSKRRPASSYSVDRRSADPGRGPE